MSNFLSKISLIFKILFFLSFLNFKVFLEYNGPIKAPIEKDQQIASLKVSTKDEVMLDIPIYSSEKVKKINFFKSLFTSLNYMIWGDV